MGRHRIDSLDKNRFASQDNLREEKYAASKQCAARRSPGKRLHHPDIKKGTELGKQAHPIQQDLYAARHPQTLLEELAKIREKATELKKKKRS